MVIMRLLAGRPGLRSWAQKHGDSYKEVHRSRVSFLWARL